MALGGEAVDGHAVGEQVLDQRVVGIGLGVDAVDVVVVEEQQRLRIRLMRPAEAVGDDLGAELAEPDVPLEPQLRIVVEDLVDHIPLLHPAGVAAHHGGDVVFQDLAQLLGAVIALREPGRVLVVPHQGVAAHHLAVRLGEVHDRVRVLEGVDVRRRAQVVPLHLVLRRERGELRGEHLAVGLIARERIGVVLVGVVPAAGDGAADLQRASRGEGEVVLLGQARRFRLPVAGRLLRSSAPSGGGGCRCGGGHRGGHCSGGEDLAASHGSPSTSSSDLHCSGLPLLVHAPRPPQRPTGRRGLNPSQSRA